MKLHSKPLTVEKQGFLWRDPQKVFLQIFAMLSFHFMIRHAPA